MSDSSDAPILRSSSRRLGGDAWVVALWVAVGAYLSFTLEPMVGRMVLPKYGGSAHVWTVSMMVFQGLLLLGYVYAHYFGWRNNRRHLALLFVPLLALPFEFGGPSAPDAPILTLTLRLIWHVGLHFWILTTTAVIAQAWWVRSRYGQEEPYWLYVASNAGSLVALVSYPLLLEPLAGIQTQRRAWALGYLVYLVLAIAAWRRLKPSPEEAAQAPAADPRIAPTKRDYGRWLVLSAVPSVLLLAVTNRIATEVGSFPLIWVIPLALYLGSFVVAFRRTAFTDRLADFWPEILVLFLVASAALQLTPFLLALPVLFFVICCLIHRELYRARPPAIHLTKYYVVMALGGWLGGVAVAIVAPLVFNDVYELPLGVTAAGVVLAVSRRHAWKMWWKGRPRGQRLARELFAISVFGLGAFVAMAFHQAPSLAAARSFYGVYKVRTADDDGHPYRYLMNGQTVHGVQYTEPSLARRMTSYYHSGGPIAEGLGLRPENNARVAVIGLGAGVVAADLRPGESMTFYEIDPVNPLLAREWFSYLGDSFGTVDVRTGDARLLLETEADADLYEVGCGDAFSGDGVPVHLLTAEAIDTYVSRLELDGVLLFHISNRYSDLRGVLKQAALNAGLSGAFRRGKAADGLSGDATATGVVLARDPARLRPLLETGWMVFGSNDGVPAMRLWTDDYVNVLAPLWYQLTAPYGGDVPAVSK